MFSVHPTTLIKTPLIFRPMTDIPQQTPTKLTLRYLIKKCSTFDFQENDKKNRKTYAMMDLIQVEFDD